MRVLVVDDDCNLSALITDFLTDHGYDVQTANNGREGLAIAISSPPDAILLDLQMPVMDGWTCFRLLRQKRETVDIPIIVMSGHPGGIANKEELGAEHFISKPFALEDLLCAVRAASNGEETILADVQYHPERDHLWQGEVG